MIRYHYKLMNVTTRYTNKDPKIEVISHETKENVEASEYTDLDQYCLATNYVFVSFAPTPVVNAGGSSFIAVGVFKEVGL